ncbi:efflux RND transporter periplasmic adaptor subunit [Limnohabitans sp.]|uniref:efflux RND transporter periplasmic adaptor subunit n=1 Tax=Limnohabitans sp. TaxID=1907725 RepID=UPI0038BDB461
MTPTDPRLVIEGLQQLVCEPRTATFYADYASLVAALCRADRTLVIEALDGQWLLRGCHGTPEDAQWLVGQIKGAMIEQADRLGYAHETVTWPDGWASIVLLIPLTDVAKTYLLLTLPERERGALKEALVRALLTKDLRPLAVPKPQTAVAAQSGQGQDTSLLDLLDLATLVMQQRHFGAAALSLVNGVARQLELAQAALCWREASEGVLLAVSHMDHFDKTSRLVRGLEAAAGEVLSVDQVVRAERTPAGGGAQTAPAAHLALLENMPDIDGVLSLPLRDESGMTQAVLILMTKPRAVDDEVLNHLLLVLEMIYPRLREQYQQHLWVGGRLKARLLDGLQLLLGPGRPWVKFGAVCVALTLLVLTFGRWDYRVEASCQLTTDSTRQITAQIDGRVDQVLFDTGSLIHEGDALLVLDLVDLKQQELEVLSEMRRYQAEEDKSRATLAIADSQVARFRREQVEARYKRILLQQEQAVLRAPFDGVVVEGERRNLLGASVRKGDKLLRVAQVQGLYLAIQVPEKAIRDIEPNAQGSMLLLSQTGHEVRFKVASFVPMAQVRGQEGNHFLVKAEILGQPEDWWRPGMTGLAKIEVGSRSIAWIVFHDLVDLVRLKFWF